MFKKIKVENHGKETRISDHLSNERTFLSWVRTSLGIMAFGFVIERFSFFLKQLGHFFEKPHTPESTNPSSSLQDYSSRFGIFLVFLGGLLCVLSFFKYRQVQRRIEEDTYQPSMLLDIMLTLSVLLIGIFLIFI